ncbi:hypothetical protein HMPREF0569_0033, partial [Micrococcus luteus SK58]
MQALSQVRRVPGRPAVAGSIHVEGAVRAATPSPSPPQSRTGPSGLGPEGPHRRAARDPGADAGRAGP